MYVTQSNQCNLPNSETPMTAARIAAQSARGARKGQVFVDGNNTMSSLCAALTPPVPSGTCSDLTSSLSMFNSGRFPLRPYGRGRLSTGPTNPAPVPAAGSTPGWGPYSTAISTATITDEDDPAAVIQAAVATLAATPVPANAPAASANSAGTPASSGATSVLPSGSSAASPSTPMGGAGPNGQSISGGNPSGVNYPHGSVQDVLQAIVPSLCAANPGGGYGPSASSGNAQMWGILGLIAMGLFAFAYRDQK